MEQLTSRDNPLIKNCKALAESASQRREQGLVFLEGMRLCGDAARARAAVRTLLVTPEALEKWQTELEPLLAWAEEHVLLTPQLAKHISGTQSPQGVFCLCAMPDCRPPAGDAAGCVLLLDRLQDPGNLGTIIRTAEAFGAREVILSRDCADLWSPKVLRGAMGSCFRQSFRVTEDLAGAVGGLREQGVAVYGAALAADAVSPAQMAPGPGGVAVVVGNEGSGVSAAVLAACGRCVRIPMTAQIESLNAATAAAVLLWEMAKLK